MAREITSVPLAPNDVQFICLTTSKKYITEGNEPLVPFEVEGEHGKTATVTGICCPGCKKAAITFSQDVKGEYDVSHLTLVGR